VKQAIERERERASACHNVHTYMHGDSINFTCISISLQRAGGWNCMNIVAALQEAHWLAGWYFSAFS